MLNQRIRDYEIAAIDPNNYTLGLFRTVPEFSKKGTPNENAGKEFVTNIGFHNSIESAIKRLIRLEADKQDTLKEWLEEYRTIVSELETMFFSGNKT